MNYWIVQSNPRKFTIIQEIRNAFSEKLPVGYQRMSYWHIKRIPKSMSPDDIVFVWKSDGGDKDTKGIYAKAKVFSVGPHSKPLTQHKIDAVLESVGLDLDWYDSEAEAKNRAYPYVVIEYTRHLLEPPLLANKIAKVPELGTLLVLRFYQKTLYDLTEDQGRILDKMTDS